MAGAVAYSFVLSFFPFCIFLGALAGYFGGEVLAKEAIARLFELVPEPVAQAIAPEVMAVMGRSRFGLLTVGALIALFFATSAIESLRAALNVAYRVKERRSYLWCLLESMLFVVVSAVGMLVLTWGVVVGPQVAARFKPDWLLWLADTTWVALISPLRHRHRRHRPPARRLSPVAGGGPAPPCRRLARRGAQHPAVGDRGAAVRLVADDQRLLALLRRPHAHHERAGVLPGERHHRHRRGRAQPRHRRGQAPARGGRGAQRRRDDDAAAALARELSGGERMRSLPRVEIRRGADHPARQSDVNGPSAPRTGSVAGNGTRAMRAIISCGRRAAAQVGALVGRIGADDEKIARRLEAEMAGARRQQGDVPRRDRDLVAARAAEHETRAAGGEAQHLVHVGVIVVKGIDPVAPLGRPAVAPEQILERRCRIAARDGHGLAIEQHRQAWIVRHPAVGGAAAGLQA